LILSQLQDASNSARNDDVGKTNSTIVDYFIPCSRETLEYDREEFPLPGKNHYEERGWCHPEYAMLLYPQALLDHMMPDESM
jgi:predicted metalloenzyme YecM